MKELNVKNECDSIDINNLKEWFSSDKLKLFKLKKCPNMPSNSSIQNSIDEMIIRSDNEIISIEYKIKGLNNIQEKSWNVHQTDSFLIKGFTLVKF